MQDVKLTLGKKIGDSFSKLLGMVIVIICLESVLLSGILSVVNNEQENEAAAIEYAEKVDKAMQSKAVCWRLSQSGFPADRSKKRRRSGLMWTPW